MFVIDKARWSKDDDKWLKATPLFKEVFGYTDDDIKNFIKVQENHYFPPLAINVSLEQAKLAIQPFWDYDLSVFVCEFDDNSLELLDFGSHTQRLGLIEQPPKSHYYDEPIIKVEQRVDPFNPPRFHRAWVDLSITGYTSNPQPTTPTITCPYCNSTNTKKISGLSKAGSVALWGIFALGKTTKQWHCNDCGSDF